MARPRIEWWVWETKAGVFTLPDGRRVRVRCGDEVLLERLPEGAYRILGHKPVTRH